jgi:hypothetical protein
LFFFGLLSAQTPDKTAIMQSGQYYYGSGISGNEQRARALAVAELTSQISMIVKDNFRQKIVESSKGIDEDVKSVLESYSGAMLNNVQSIKKQLSDGKIEVFCYITKEEVNVIFEERKELIYHMYQNAADYEKSGNYAFALKLYYFGLILANSIPEQSIEYDTVNLTLKIPQAINRIILNSRIEVIADIPVSDKERRIDLKVTQKYNPVGMLDFTFWDGSKQVAVTARDGQASIQLFSAGASLSELKLNIKYDYYEAREEYKAVSDLWNLVAQPAFGAMITVPIKVKPVTKSQIQQNLSKAWNLKLEYKENSNLAQKITTETIRFLEALSASDENQIKKLYAADAFLCDKILNYRKYNHPAVMDKDVAASINKTRSGYEVRKIRMEQSYPSIARFSTEYLVLDFKNSGELNDLNLSITEDLYQIFVKQGGAGHDWAERQEIIKFIEKYRTAYLTRDIETVNMMFAEDALILVGRKIERRKIPDDLLRYERLSNEPEYEYLKLTKEKYIDRQKEIFAKQKDILLDFGTFKIIPKNDPPGVFGVEMRQSYLSTTYSDEGYLFLMIDFAEKDPLIYVRAWQPNEWDEKALVKTANFIIRK